MPKVMLLALNGVVLVYVIFKQHYYIVYLTNCLLMDYRYKPEVGDIIVGRVIEVSLCST